MKAEATKHKMKNAFLELARNTSVHKISITNLVVHAGVSRGTFYTHYENIHDMLEDIGQDLLNGLEAIWQVPVTHHSVLHLLPSSSEQFVQYLSENRDIFLLLLDQHGDPSFLPRWVDHLRNAMLNRLRTESILPTSEIERVVAFVAHHGIHGIRDSFFTGDFPDVTFDTLSLVDSILHFIVIGHQQVTHAESMHERDKQRDHSLSSSYLY